MTLTMNLESFPPIYLDTGHGLIDLTLLTLTLVINFESSPHCSLKLLGMSSVIW
jgi:hypothetical protein